MRGGRIEAHRRHRTGDGVRHPRREGVRLQTQRPVQRKAAPAAGTAAVTSPPHLHPAQPGGPFPPPRRVPGHCPAAAPAFRRRQGPAGPPGKQPRRRRTADGGGVPERPFHGAGVRDARRQVRRQLRQPRAELRRDRCQQRRQRTAVRPQPRQRQRVLRDVAARHLAAPGPVPGETTPVPADHRWMDRRVAFGQTPGYATASGCL